ncbi:DUF2828 family protein [uncultured Ruminococcus sp.]|uniref:DUF2828 family protein n=1 Tax=uncultured Ruminococcus sp. TaxID=165186 RepID=UPI0026379FCE|nr:DUF2828 family protein [uncultured Ruminococcus sp.]
MLNYLKNEYNMTYTENGGTAYRSSESFCLDMFFKAGAMRNSTAAEIADVVIRAYAEDPDKTMKIVFFARDARGGLGERRFFRIAIAALVRTAPDAVKKNISLFAEYGRFDDLCVLLDTPFENAAVEVIKAQLDKDIAAMNAKKPASLLAKWMPSVNASSKETRNIGRHLAASLGMTERTYRKTLSALRRYTDILENRLREMRKLYAQNGYKLPYIVFWNVNARCDAVPVNRSETGAALVSGYSPAVFDMVMGGDCTPESVMDRILSSERYSAITAA